MPVRDRARAYVERMPDSIQGQGGSLALFNVAAVLMRGFSLEEAEGLALLSEWNERHAQPRWSPAELRHKIHDGARADRAQGYLLREGEDERGVGASGAKSGWQKRARLRAGARARTGSAAAPGAVEGQGSSTVGRAHAPASAPPLEESPAERRHRTWPAFSQLTLAELQDIATLRNVPLMAVELVRRAGFLTKARVEGHACFILGEGSFAQARRFDGGLLPVQGGQRWSKAKNLPGSEGAFIGRKWVLDSRCPVLLVEGVIGLVEAVAACQLLRGALDCACLAAVSAGSRFARDPALLQSLRRRKVCIIPDAGVAGSDAAAAWLGELEWVEARVRIQSLPPPFGDLGDLVAQVYQEVVRNDGELFNGGERGIVGGDSPMATVSQHADLLHSVFL